MNNTRTAAIYTLGCKVNQYESEAIAEHLKKHGVEILSGNATVAIINTCSVTGESDRKCRQTIRRAIRENPGSFVLVTGCLSQVDPNSVAAIPGVSFVCGNKNKMTVAEKALEYLDGCTSLSCPEVAVTSLEGAPFEKMAVDHSERTRAYIKVEDGCESHCAYCIIPRARGKIRSKPLEEVVAEAKELAAKGYRELVLAGIEVSAYGSDLGSVDLADLVNALDPIEGLERIRFPSIDPSFMKPSFTDRIAGCAHLAPHFHLSLQSGCDRTLHRMRRRYNTAQVRRYVEYLREKLPNVQFTADVIVGFPGETETDFAEACDFVASLGLLSAHVFAYSRRKGTEAAEMPEQIPEQTKQWRSAQLIALCKESQKRVLAEYIKKHPTGKVLFEQQEKGVFFGRLANYIGVEVETAGTDEDLHGQIREVELSFSHKNDRLCGKLLKTP